MAKAYAREVVGNTQSYLQPRLQIIQQTVREAALGQRIDTDDMVRINSWLEEVRELIARGPEGDTEDHEAGFMNAQVGK